MKGMAPSVRFRLRRIYHLSVHVAKHALHKHFGVTPIFPRRDTRLCVDVFGQTLQLLAQVRSLGLDTILDAQSPAPLPVLNAFIEALAHVKGQYDVNDEDQARLRRA